MNTSKIGRAAWVLLAAAWWAQPGVAAADVPSHVDRPALETPSDATVTFPTTAVGHTSTMCEGLCYNKNGSPPGTCDGSGPETLDHDVSPPFVATDYTVGATSPSCTGTPVSLPTSLSSGQVLWFNINFSPTSNGTFSDTLTISGFNFNLTGSTGLPGAGCTRDDHTACLLSGRFQVTVNYTSNSAGSGAATVMSFNGSRAESDQSAFLWFFSSTNFEMGLKVLNGCGVNNHFWVFISGLTDQGWTVHIHDTQSGANATYTNPIGRLTPTTADISSPLQCP